MAKILVTGATGRLGNAVVRSLLQKIPASDVAALARDVDKDAPLAALGVEVRAGDYTNYDSLVAAFEGIEKIYLVSAVAFSDRVAQHKNVIVAAERAGVRHLIYTSIQRINDDLAPIEGVTESDTATERMLEKSRMTYTIVQHPLYANDLPFLMGANAAKDGFSVPAGQGRMGIVTFAELAEAGAALLTQADYESRRYLLSGEQTWSFQNIAEAFSRMTGKSVGYQPISGEAFISARESEGWRRCLGRFWGLRGNVDAAFRYLH